MGRSVKRKTAIYLSIVIIFFITTISEASEYRVLINKLDYKVITSKLPITGKEISKSANGRIRQRWTIKCKADSLCGTIEFIGNNQKDVDKVCWTCREYDHQGGRIKPVNKKNFCHRIFIKILIDIVDYPEELANVLITQGEKTNPQPAIYNLKNSDFSIETDGEYYAVRRKSRLRNDLANY